MAEDFIRESIDLPFFIADAWLAYVFEAISEKRLQPAKISARRHQLSTGSARIDLFHNKTLIGRFDLIAISDRRTLFDTYLMTKQDSFRALLSDVAERIHATLVVVAGEAQIENELVLALEELRSDVQSLIAAAADTLPPPATPQPPQRGDPVDAWLDWRDSERKRGHHLTLDQLAEQSDWSLSTLKKQSARRKVRGK